MHSRNNTTGASLHELNYIVTIAKYAGCLSTVSLYIDILDYVNGIEIGRSMLNHAVHVIHTRAVYVGVTSAFVKVVCLTLAEEFEKERAFWVKSGFSAGSSNAVWSTHDSSTQKTLKHGIPGSLNPKPFN